LVLTADLRFLIEKGADVKSITSEGDNCLHLLCRRYKKENLFVLIQILAEAGIDLKAKTKDGSTAVQLLWKRKSEMEAVNIEEIIQFLISF
jgi:ankyrin repeat protein